MNGQTALQINQWIDIVHSPNYWIFFGLLLYIFY